MVTELLGGADHCRAVNVQGFGLFHQLLRNEFAVMATILLDKEGDLKAIHRALLELHELRHRSNVRPDLPVRIAAIEFHIYDLRSSPRLPALWLDWDAVEVASNGVHGLCYDAEHHGATM